MSSIVPGIDILANISEIYEITRLQLSLIWNLILINAVLYILVMLEIYLCQQKRYLCSDSELHENQKNNIKNTAWWIVIVLILSMLMEVGTIGSWSFYWGAGYQNGTTGKFQLTTYLQSPIGLMWVTINIAILLPALVMGTFYTLAYKFLIYLEK